MEILQVKPSDTPSRQPHSVAPIPSSPTYERLELSSDGIEDIIDDDASANSSDSQSSTDSTPLPNHLPPVRQRPGMIGFQSTCEELFMADLKALEKSSGFFADLSELPVTNGDIPPFELEASPEAIEFFIAHIKGTQPYSISTTDLWDVYDIARQFLCENLETMTRTMLQRTSSGSHMLDLFVGAAQHEDLDLARVAISDMGKKHAPRILSVGNISLKLLERVPIAWRDPLIALIIKERERLRSDTRWKMAKRTVSSEPAMKDLDWDTISKAFTPLS